MRTPLIALLGSLLVAHAAAQLPSFRIDAAVRLMPGRSVPVFHRLIAAPGHPYVILVDLGSGPTNVLGTRLELGFTPALTVLTAGVTQGVDLGMTTMSPAVPAGVPFYLQVAVFDRLLATNGLFAASNPESTIAFAPPDLVLVDRFDDPALEGFSGNFDRNVRDRLQGGAVRRRVHSTVDPQGVPFQLPLLTPLNPSGARAQLVYRAVDLGAGGEEELIVAVRWRPLGPVLPDRFAQMEMRLGHTPVTPDYTVDPWSALPAFPASGLDPVFRANEDPARPTVQVFRGGYDIAPRALRPDGYMPYPNIRPFAYDGRSSLLLEFRLPQQTASGVNGQQVRLMVQSSPLPAARNFATGTPANPVDPNTVLAGRGDNAMYDYQFEFLRVNTVATSPWRVARAGADYQPPYVAATTPPGTGLALEFRGAADAMGTNATAWSRNIDTADGRSHLQYRVTFLADPRSAAVPSIDTLIVRYR